MRSKAEDDAEKVRGNCKRGVRRVRGVSQRKFAYLRLQLIVAKYSGYVRTEVRPPSMHEFFSTL